MIKAPSILTWDPQNRPRAQGDTEKSVTQTCWGLERAWKGSVSAEEKPQKKKCNYKSKKLQRD